MNMVVNDWVGHQFQNGGSCARSLYAQVDHQLKTDNVSIAFIFKHSLT